VRVKKTDADLRGKKGGRPDEMVGINAEHERRALQIPIGRWQTYAINCAFDNRNPAGVYFGTSTGTLFYSRDAGDSWHVMAEHLPPIYGISAALR
jgi:hypothetical protein